MNGRTTARALAGAATVLVLAGGGVAYAASDDSAPSSGAQTAPSRAAAPGDRGPGGPGGPGLAFGHHRGGGFGFADAGGAADYLGLSQEELRRRLLDSRSLADVARADGKSVQGLEDALVADAKERLDRAVDDGWLGARARDEMLQRLREHVGELVQMAGPKDLPRPAFRDGKGGCAPGGPDGPGGLDAPDAPKAPDGSVPPSLRDRGDSDEAPDEGSSTTPGSWRDAPAASVWS